MDGRSVARFLMPKMNGFLYENHCGGPTLLNVLDALNVLNELNMFKDALSIGLPGILSFFPLFLSHFPVRTPSCAHALIQALTEPT